MVWRADSGTSEKITARKVKDNGAFHAGSGVRFFSKKKRRDTRGARVCHKMFIYFLKILNAFVR